MKAILYYKNGQCHFITAGSLKRLRDKCKPFETDDAIEVIEVVQTVCYLKSHEE